MALNTQFADVLVDAMATAFATKFNSAKIYIIAGTIAGSSTTGSNIITGSVLAMFTMNATAFGSPTSGVIVANAIATVAAGAFTATASFVRFMDSTWTGTDAHVMSGSGASFVLMDCTAGTSSANLIISPITAGTNVSIGSFTHEVLNASSGQ